MRSPAGVCSRSTTSSPTRSRPTSSSSMSRRPILPRFTASARIAQAPIATAPTAVAPTARHRGPQPRLPPARTPPAPPRGTASLALLSASSSPSLLVHHLLDLAFLPLPAPGSTAAEAEHAEGRAAPGRCPSRSAASRTTTPRPQQVYGEQGDMTITKLRVGRRSLDVLHSGVCPFVAPVVCVHE
jgi:hypothetical protein